MRAPIRVTSAAAGPIGTAWPPVQLPAVAPAQARWMRLLNDRRFLPWIDALAPGARARRLPPQPGAVTLVTLHIGQGAVELAADALAWPALALAADCPDADHACGLVSALLAGPLAALRACLPDAAVTAVRRGPAAAGPRVAVAGAAFGLNTVDEGAALQLAGVLSHRPAPAAAVRALRLRARLQLFARELPPALLHSLAPGDVVLGLPLPAPGMPLPCRFSMGWGPFMQATAEIDLDRNEAVVTGPPQTGPEDDRAAPEPGPPLGAIGEIGVPVSFEIDSARMTLDDLAAIGPGTVLTLDAPATTTRVLLVCLGQVVAQGQLVTVGDRLGVRVLRTGARAEAESDGGTQAA